MQSIARGFGTSGAALYLRGQILDTWQSYVLLFLTTVGAVVIIKEIIGWITPSSTSASRRIITYRPDIISGETDDDTTSDPISHERFSCERDSVSSIELSTIDTSDGMVSLDIIPL